MAFKRIIPTLLFRNGGLYKSVKFGRYKYIGDPINAVKIYNEKEVDELVILDIEASSNKSGPNYGLLESLTAECFMPLTYGGGISSITDLDKLFSIGVEKASINSAFLTESLNINEAVKNFGSSALVASLNIKRDLFKKFRVYDYSNKRKIKTKLSDHLKHIEDSGFGEIFVTDIDRDGTFTGLDIDLVNLITDAVNLPVVFSGGVSSHKNIFDVFDTVPNLSGIGAGSVFVYQGIHNAVLINYVDNNERFKI